VNLGASGPAAEGGAKLFEAQLPPLVLADDDEAKLGVHPHHSGVLLGVAGANVARLWELEGELGQQGGLSQWA
jgi:hypothetical protein